MAASVSETQTAIDILKADNERLNAQVVTLTTERDRFKADHDSTAKERDTLKAQVGTPDEHRKRADELEHKLRVHTHKAEFAKIAEDAGVHRDMIDDLFSLSGYTPKSDEIDPKAFSDLVGDLKKSKPRYFADPAQQQQQTEQRPEQQQQRHIPGQGRGSSHDATRSGITITRKQLADPKFMLNPRNKELIKSAAKEGRITD